MLVMMIIIIIIVYRSSRNNSNNNDASNDNVHDFPPRALGCPAQDAAVQGLPE